MGSYAEKLFRLNVCEELKKDAPGIDYSAGEIVHMKVREADLAGELPAVVLSLVQLKDQCSGSITEAWNAKKVA